MSLLPERRTVKYNTRNSDKLVVPAGMNHSGGVEPIWEWRFSMPENLKQLESKTLLYKKLKFYLQDLALFCFQEFGVYIVWCIWNSGVSLLFAFINLLWVHVFCFLFLYVIVLWEFFPQSLKYIIWNGYRNNCNGNYHLYIFMSS